MKRYSSHTAGLAKVGAVQQPHAGQRRLSGSRRWAAAAVVAAVGFTTASADVEAQAAPAADVAAPLIGQGLRPEAAKSVVVKPSAHKKRRARRVRRARRRVRPVVTTPTTSPATTAPAAPVAMSDAAVALGQCVAITNSMRTDAGLVALTVDSRLVRAAQLHSDYQAATLTMAHVGANGSRGGDRLTAQGYRWWMWGENVAAGQGDCQSVMSAWWNSSGHRANILNGSARRVGFGVTRGANGVLFWTMLVAAGS